MKGNFIPENLKNLRTMLGHTLNTLADATGISFNRLHYIESGFDKPEMSEVIILARTLFVKTKYFYVPDKISGKQQVVNPDHISFRFRD